MSVLDPVEVAEVEVWPLDLKGKVSEETLVSSSSFAIVGQGKTGSDHGANCGRNQRQRNLRRFL